MERTPPKQRDLTPIHNKSTQRLQNYSTPIKTLPLNPHHHPPTYSTAQPSSLHNNLNLNLNINNMNNMNVNELKNMYGQSVEREQRSVVVESKRINMKDSSHSNLRKGAFSVLNNYSAYRADRDNSASLDYNSSVLRQREKLNFSVNDRRSVGKQRESSLPRGVLNRNSGGIGQEEEGILFDRFRYMPMAKTFKTKFEYNVKFAHKPTSGHLSFLNKKPRFQSLHKKSQSHQNDYLGNLGKMGFSPQQIIEQPIKAQ